MRPQHLIPTRPPSIGKEGWIDGHVRYVPAVNAAHLRALSQDIGSQCRRSSRPLYLKDLDELLKTGVRHYSGEREAGSFATPISISAA